MNTRSVAVMLFEGVNATDVAGPLEAFSTITGPNGAMAYDLNTWTIANHSVRSVSGLRLVADRLADDPPAVDLLIVPGGFGIREPATLDALAEWLRRYHDRFSSIASICTGAYALAESGLLDGRTVTTHWSYARDLQRRYPRVRVCADALSWRDGHIYSSGGVTAGIDLALDIIERDFGREAAMRAARYLVVFLRRPGAQAQFSMPLKLQTKAPGTINDVCIWAINNLGSPLTVEALAAKAGLSTRQFSRRFRESFEEAPATYLKRVRLDLGRTLLEQGICTAEVAHAAGFISTDGFRRAFDRAFGVTPGEYRKRFLRSEPVVQSNSRPSH